MHGGKNGGTNLVPRGGKLASTRPAALFAVPAGGPSQSCTRTHDIASAQHPSRFWAFFCQVCSRRIFTARGNRVPLTEAALRLIERLPRIAGSDFIFSAPRGGQLSDKSLTQVLRRIEVDAVPNGFRSTFRDWTGARVSGDQDPLLFGGVAAVLAGKRLKSACSQWRWNCARPHAPP
jgi:hypothetical protein